LCIGRYDRLSPKHFERNESELEQFAVSRLTRRFTIDAMIGAVAAQLSGHVIAHASDAMPMLWLMLAFGLALAAAFLALCGSGGSFEERAPARRQQVARIESQRNPGLSTLLR
jgi:hypothetical protein